LLSVAVVDRDKFTADYEKLNITGAPRSSRFHTDSSNYPSLAIPLSHLNRVSLAFFGRESITVVAAALLSILDWNR
jgi:hypothetical protein